VTATRTYYLQAESQQDARAWVAAIREREGGTARFTGGCALRPLIDPPDPDPRALLSCRHLAIASLAPPARGDLIGIGGRLTKHAAHVLITAVYARHATPSSPRIGGPPDASKVVMSGYITKMGKRRNWRKRWFMLNGEMLMYAGSHMVSSSKASAAPVIDVGFSFGTLTSKSDRTRKCTDKYHSHKSWTLLNTMFLQLRRHHHTREGDRMRWTTRC
jgi:hypothetical protein